MGEDDQNPKLLKTLMCLKYGFIKSSSNDSKNTGGVKAILTFSKQKEIFLADGFPYVNPSNIFIFPQCNLFAKIIR